MRVTIGRQPRARSASHVMLARLLSLFRARQLDRDLDEELRHHVEALEAEHRARGLSNCAASIGASTSRGWTFGSDPYVPDLDMNQAKRIQDRFELPRT